jgi:hypothetical protein
MVNIFSPVITPRLQYVLGIIFRDHLRVPYRLTADRALWLASPGIRIHYSNEMLPGSFRIPPSGFLSETYEPGKPPESDPMAGAIPLAPATGARAGTGSDVTVDSWPFDLFGSVFYLISRYEEYLAEAKFDRLGRYDPTSSWAYKNSCLERPLIDEWLQRLEEVLVAHSGTYTDTASGGTDNDVAPGGAGTGLAPGGAGIGLAPGRHERLRFAPTYDIDLPWCYQHKPLWVKLAYAVMYFLQGRWKRLVELYRVNMGQVPDPFDNFYWLDQVHAALETSVGSLSRESPVYFFPVAASHNRYDQNPKPSQAAYQELIQRHAAKYPIGIHPSFYSSSQPGLLAAEIGLLSRITGLPITISRYHYIHFRLPQGYRLLIDNGIRADYSMGYGEQNGFRASYSRPFGWYDLEKEMETPLKVVPFCFMEATSYYQKEQDGPATLQEMERYSEAIRKTGGRMTTIWHNSSLNENPRWIGWRKVYCAFLTHNFPDLIS